MTPLHDAIETILDEIAERAVTRLRDDPRLRKVIGPDDVIKGVTAAGRWLHMGNDTVLRLAKSGELPGRCIDGRWRFSKAELSTWLGGRDAGPGAPL